MKLLIKIISASFFLLLFFYSRLVIDTFAGPPCFNLGMPTIGSGNGGFPFTLCMGTILPYNGGPTPTPGIAIATALQPTQASLSLPLWQITPVPYNGPFGEVWNGIVRKNSYTTPSPTPRLTIYTENNVRNFSNFR